MKYKSLGEKLLANFLQEKKRFEKLKEESTCRLIKKRDEALKKFKDTQREEFQKEVAFYDKILNHKTSKKTA